MVQVAVDHTLWRDARNQIAQRTRDQQNAEDLLHSAYLRLDRYQGEKPVECAVGFLTQTAVRLRIDHHRRENFLRDHVFESTFCFDQPAPLQDKVAEDRQRLSRLKDGLDQLQPRTREVFLLHRVNELRQREIASLLQISVSAVEKHIAKAVPFLARWMKGW